MRNPLTVVVSIAASLLLNAGAAEHSRPAAPASTNRLAGAVTLTQDAESFTLANGLVLAKIAKSTGTLVSLQYQGVELLAQGRGGGNGGYWSSVGRGRPGSAHQGMVRIDPAENGGARAEVSCRLGNDPQSPDSPLDADYRYALGRGEHWLYVYSVLEHKPGYPAFGVGEARYCLKLNPRVFDYLFVDANRHRVMPSGYDWDHGAPLNMQEARRMTTGIHQGEAEHKYDYSAVLSETPAYGWLSTRERLGLWLVNPAGEYLGGGPTKAELTGHLDVNPGGLPTLLNMWVGSHYGGTTISVATNEHWTKVVGPFLLYCNAASFRGGEKTAELARDVLWRDALARAAKESQLWPYAWVADPNYPLETARSAVSGQLVLRDPLAPGAKMSNVWVGVTAPDYLPPPRAGFGGPGGFRRGTNDLTGRGSTAGLGAMRGGFPALVDWQRDAKFYQYWARADAQGRFTIPHVRPGLYTLHALAAGVLGEFSRTNLLVAAGKGLALGALDWEPQHFGRTVWQIGIPDRTAREFRHGDHYWQWGLYFDYPKEFPHDIDYIVGLSDWRHDWNYVQPPRIQSRDVPMTSEAEEQNESTGAERTRLAGRDVTPTTWSITFKMPSQPHGRATLRLAFCGTHAGTHVEVLVNGTSVGETGILPSTSAMQRDGISGYWIEKDIGFDAGLLTEGANSIKLFSHANSWSQGVMYDCLRLEVDEGKMASVGK